jgi:hypothetical protein
MDADYKYILYISVAHPSASPHSHADKPVGDSSPSPKSWDTVHGNLWDRIIQHTPNPNYIHHIAYLVFTVSYCFASKQDTHFLVHSRAVAS